MWPFLPACKALYGRGGNTLFALYFLVPAIIAVVDRRRRASPPLREVWVLTLPFLAIFFVSVISSGEARYRVPFDGFFMILGIHLWERAILRTWQGRDAEREGIPRAASE